MNKRRAFRNDGMPAGAKWLNEKKGIKVTFQPRKKGRTRVLPTVVFTRRPDQGPAGIECRVCGTSLLSLVSHVPRIHGLTTSQYRTEYGADAPMMASELLDAWVVQAKEVAQRHHVANKGQCLRCGRLFQKGKGSKHPHSKTMYCSKKCLARELSALRSDPERVAELLQKTTRSAGRIAYIDRLKKEKRIRQTVPCVICGILFTAKRRVGAGLVGLCSYPCRSAHRKRAAE
jgi:hypothetical protein